jgi:hypothetical protein
MKILNAFALVLLLAVAALGGDEPWKGKPYQLWTEKDLERIFAYSPWSRTVALTRTWLPLKAEELPQLISGGVRQLPKGLEQSDEGRLGAEVNFNIYWMSSRVMRAASARKAALQGEKKDVDLEKYASQPQEEIQIVIQSEDMIPFIRKDEKFFQAKAFLQPKKSKQRISPSHVQFERDAQGILVKAAIFFFPRKMPSGDPLIPPDEKSVEFTCPVEGSTLRVNFEPQKMTDQNGPAL